jgi:hypothetical protein
MLIDRCGTDEPVWTLALLPEQIDASTNCALDDLEDLIFHCRHCTLQTTGIVYHNRPDVSREEIEDALFETFGHGSGT